MKVLYEMNNIKDIVRDIPSYMERIGVPKGWVYIGEEKKKRYVLGQPGNHTILIIGINPSWAVAENDDRTISKVREVIRKPDNPYDGWLMMNLYPVVTPHPDDLKEADCKLIDNNHIVFRAILDQYPVDAVWVAWGNAIDKKKRVRKGWLHKERDEILDVISDNVPVVCFGGSTKTGNPRHPLWVDINSSHFEEWSGSHG